MKQFFKFMLATMLGIIISVFLLVIVLISMAGLSEKPVKIEPNSILHIKLESTILDRAADSPFENFNKFSGEFEDQLGLKKDILDNLKKAKTDDKIKGLLLDLEIIDAGMATVDEIRNGLIDFKTSGKFIYAYSELYTQKAYYLASVADSVFIYPEGVLEFRGLSTQITFLKGMLEKLEVQPQIIRGKNNKFKSAIEPLILDKMSDANREQTSKYIGAIWNHMVKGISESRKISTEELNLIADSFNIRKADDAVKYRLADAVVYKDELLTMLKDKTGAEDEKKIKFVTLKKYSRSEEVEEEEESKGKFNKDKIAVIYAQGGIESGKGDNETIGSEKISEAIRKARKDEKVKAIVLRVNSPGGSALASDVIWREMGIAKKVKPVIVSMGDVAASGGYYISCNADTIVASPVTITGSIGVFGVIPNAQNFFNNKLGITFDGVKTNKYSDMGTNISRPLSNEEFNIIQEEVDDIYNDFIGKVSDGRGITKEEVDSIGQGRVWSGSDAKNIGLIDEFGGLEKAIEIAAAKAGLKDYRLTYLPRKGDPFEQILNEIMGGGDEESRIIANALGANYKYYQQLKTILSMSGTQARLPYLIEIY